jgi:hypothetical protein
VRLTLADTSGSERGAVPKMKGITAIFCVRRSLVVEPGSLSGGVPKRDRDDPKQRARDVIVVRLEK